MLKDEDKALYLIDAFWNANDTKYILQLRFVSKYLYWVSDDTIIETRDISYFIHNFEEIMLKPKACIDISYLRRFMRNIMMFHVRQTCAEKQNK